MLLTIIIRIAKQIQNQNQKWQEKAALITLQTMVAFWGRAYSDILVQLSSATLKMIPCFAH
jgi:hypothetical protein